MVGVSLDDRVADLAQRIAEAPFAMASWPEVLQDVAILTGGWGGQLFGVGPAGLAFDLAGGIPAEVLREFEARGGPDPAVNPRVRAVLSERRIGVMLSEPDFIDEADRRSHPFYHDFLDKVDTPYANVAIAGPAGDTMVYAAVLRSARQGPTTDTERAVQNALLPHLAAAARAQMVMEAHSVTLAFAALDGLDLAVVVCDFAGRITAVSATAETLLADGTLVLRRHGRLVAATAEGDRRLQSAIDQQAAVLPDVRPAAAPVMLVSSDGRESLAADVLRIPAASQAMGGAVLIAFGASRPRATNFLADLGLTPTEAEVARYLAESLSAAEIAELRNCGVETVRSHIKAVYAKLGVRRRLELAAKLRGLI